MTLPKTTIDRSKQYTEPVLCLDKDAYIYFYAFDPEEGVLRRKRIRINKELKNIKGKRAQREYAEGIRQRLRDELRNGYNPWINIDRSLTHARFEDVCDIYKRYLARQMESFDMREESVTSYLSYMRVMRRWIEDNGRHVYYAYQFNKRIVNDFLDYVYLEKENTINTRNNYLAWIKTFSRFLIQKSYINDDPTAGLSAMKRRSKKKNRDVIPDGILARVREHLYNNNKYYLLACYLLYYVFVRPHEMSYLKVGDISVSDQTLYIHGEHAKNRNDAVVTLPAHVMKLMIELRVLSKPSNFYLFSEGFMPGRERRSEKAFRDYWIRHVRGKLGLPGQYKFYSLKDTGITNMLRNNTDVLSVRDQARHSSILITDTYTPKDIKAANELLKNYRGAF